MVGEREEEEECETLMIIHKLIQIIFIIVLLITT